MKNMSLVLPNFQDDIAVFKVDHVESMTFKIVLKPGDYRLQLSATDPEIWKHIW
jgi:hypothetical protein